MNAKKAGCWNVWAAIVLCLTLCAGSVSPAAAAEEKQLFRIGSATLGTAGYIHWEAVSFLVNKYSKKFKASSFTTGGSTECVYLLDQKKIDIGHGTGLEVVAGAEGSAPFDKKYPVWQVFGWSMLSIPMVARADNKNVNTYTDLVGKPVSLAKRGSGTESLYRILLTTLGVYDGIKKSYLGFAEGYDAVVDGNVVATPASMPDGVPVPQVQDLGARIEFKVLPISQEEIDKVTKANKAIVGAVVPKTAYAKMTQDVLVPAFACIGISSPNVDDDTIYEFLKAVLDNVDELRTISKTTTAITLQNAVNWMLPGYPVHPGAARYFKEKGVWRDDFVIGTR
jgi:TRAP transporter TAXI family solute receptor